MSTDATLAGRVVIVTGAGRGIGREEALAFARAGASVVVNDLGGSADGQGASSGPAEEVAQEIRAAGGRAIANGEDVSDPDGATRLVQSALEEFGGLDVLVNNAGILRDRALVNMTIEDWDAVIRVHLRGHFCVLRAAARYWRTQSKQGRPVDARVINTSSGSGLFGNFGQAGYGAAKAGIAGLTLIAATELASYGVTVNAIAPVARTRLTATAGMSLDAEPDTFDPLDPAGIAPLVVWLAGPAAQKVTARVFHVSAGHVAVCEGWNIGPKTRRDRPWTTAELDEIIPELVAAAAPNAGVLDHQKD
ncbi:SDR family oxidoreductase [Streptosporangium sp. NPDC002607]